MTEPPPPPPPQATIDTRLLENGFAELRRQYADVISLFTKLGDNQRHQTDQTHTVLSRLLDIEGRMVQMEQRLDQRMVSIRDDIELMLKGELLGRLTHFETTSEQRLVEGMAHSMATLQEVLATARRQSEQSAADLDAAVETLVAASERHERDIATLTQAIAAIQTQPERR